MRAQLAKLWSALGEAFWALPILIIIACDGLALGLLAIDRADLLPPWLIQSAWIYSGDATGARTLLGSVASSTIDVAGTIFSITIAALTLAAGQMGPRLLRNFTRDRGNQITLGVFLGTYSYALLVLRTVRTHGSDEFTPHLSLSVGVLLAFLSVGMLVFFVGHIAGRISVDTVIDLVTDDVDDAVSRLTTTEPQSQTAADLDCSGGRPIIDHRRGYLQHLDENHLADWAAGNGTLLHLLVRPGDYVFPGAPIATMRPPVPGADAAIRASTALGRQRLSSQDLEFAVRQLEEVAVRALSPGINDPHTAMSVLVRFGAVLCTLAPRHLPSGVVERNGRPALVYARVTYDGLLDRMFHLIRQNAAGSTAIFATAFDVLIGVARVERDGTRRAGLARHADLWLDDARRTIPNASDLCDVERRATAFRSLVEDVAPTATEARFTSI